MKKIFIFILVIHSQMSIAQGVFAGSLKSWIGKAYREEKDLPFLDGFTSRGGALLSDANDPDKFAVSWFSKSTIFVAIFEVVKDNNDREILDILEIKNVGAGQELKIGDCKDGSADIVALVALVMPARKKELKAIKAWYFNRDKIRIEARPATNVTCLGMEGDD